MTPTDAEQAIYEWCTQKAPRTPAAHTLALVYASTYLDKAHLFTLYQVRDLSKPQREWALALIEGYVSGWFTAPRERVLKLMELYDIRSDQEEGI